MKPVLRLKILSHMLELYGGHLLESFPNMSSVADSRHETAAFKYIENLLLLPPACTVGGGERKI